jgi:hypothetical protein
MRCSMPTVFAAPMAKRRTRGAGRWPSTLEALCFLASADSLRRLAALKTYFAIFK